MISENGESGSVCVRERVVRLLKRVNFDFFFKFRDQNDVILIGAVSSSCYVNYNSNKNFNRDKITTTIKFVSLYTPFKVDEQNQKSIKISVF